MSRITNLFPILALVVATLLWIALNIISTHVFKNVRIDLTEDRLYTVSESTISILDSLEETLTLRLFFSEKLSRDLPVFRVYAKRVYGLLQEYQRLSNNKIRLYQLDPEPFSDAEDLAIQNGITGIPLDQTTGEQVYFGLVGTNTLDDKEVIPFFQQNREAFLEYDLSTLIYNLNDPTHTVVGILGSVPFEYGPLGIQGAARGQAQPYAIYTQLQQLFDLRILSQDDIKDGIDPVISVLMIARPRDFTPATLYAIDQFILAGGKALLLLDPFVETLFVPVDTATEIQRQASLSDLLRAWHIQLDTSTFVADIDQALPTITGTSARNIPYPAWIQVQRPYLNPDDVVTASLRVIHLASPGSLSSTQTPKPALENTQDTSITFVPLILSSPSAYSLTTDHIEKSIDDPRVLLHALQTQSPTQSPQQYVLAARLSGHFKTAFPDGAPPDSQRSPTTYHYQESAVPQSSLIIVADTDILEDRFWIRKQNFFGQTVIIPIAENGNFIINALDTLSGSETLIGLRRGTISHRPFLKIEDIKREAAQLYLTREQELQQQLQRTEEQLQALQNPSQTTTSSTLLTPTERGAMETFRTQAIRIRKELRNVQFQLKKDLESLFELLKMLNIFLMPLLISLFAIFLAVFKRYKRHQSIQTLLSFERT